MARMLGVTVEQLIGAPGRRVGAARARRRPAPARAVAGRARGAHGGRVDQELGVPHADGGLVWLSMRSARLPDGTIVAPSRRSARPRRRPARPRASRTMVDDSPDLVWMFDGHGLIEYASPSFSTALGLRQDELIGRLWRALTHPSTCPVLRAALADAGPDEPRTRCSSCACAPATAAGAGSRARRRCASAAAARSRSRSPAATSPARAPPRTRAGGCPRSSRRSSPARPTGS